MRRGRGTVASRPKPASRTGCSPTDEQLVERARGGDRAAVGLLVERHLPLVRRLAWRYRDLGLPYDDLVQEGSIGLLEALERFDPARGARFSTFAYWCVRRAQTHALTEKGHLVRLPKRLLESRGVVAAASDGFATRTGRTATVVEVAQATGLSVDDVRAVLQAPTAVVSLSGPTGADSGTSSASIPDPGNRDPVEEAAAHELREALAGALAGLSLDEQQVVRRHFGLDGAEESLAEIAHDIGLSPTKTRAIEGRALFRLARTLRPSPASVRDGLRRGQSLLLQLGPLVAVLASKAASLFDYGDVDPPV